MRCLKISPPRSFGPAWLWRSLSAWSTSHLIVRVESLLRILVVNTGPTSSPSNRWQWVPSRGTPLSPRPGSSAPSGDVLELLQQLCLIRLQGATIAEAEQVWVDGMCLIGQRAALFPGNGSVVNDFYGVVSGEWRVYIGRPAAPGRDTFALAFNSRTGAIAQGLYPRGIGSHPAIVGQQALFNFRVIYP